MATIEPDTIKMTEREFLTLMYISASTPTDISDTMFCMLRNWTNPKYGGHPDWTGENRTIADHVNRTFKLQVK